MDDKDVKALSKKQLQLGTVIALCLAVLGFWLGGRANNSEAPPQRVTLDRRDAERGRIRLISDSQRDLRYTPKKKARANKPYKSSTTNLLHCYTAEPSVNTASPLKDSEVMLSETVTTRHLANKPKDNAHTELALAPSSTSNEEEETVVLPDILNVKEQFKRAKKRHPSHQVKASEPPAESETASEAISSYNYLTYPSPSGLSKISLDVAWHNARSSLQINYGNGSELPPSVTFPISTVLRLGPETAASSFSVFGMGDKRGALSGLHLATMANISSDAPVLASKAPRLDEKLATLSDPSYPNDFVTCAVSKNYPSHLFRLTCPNPSQVYGCPLVNSHGELAGVLLDGCHSYRGHNYRIGADASILLAIAQERDLPENEDYNLTAFSHSLIHNALVAHESTSTPPISGLQRNTRAIPKKALGNFQMGMKRSEVEQIMGKGQMSAYDLRGHRLALDDRAFSYCAYPNYKLAFNYYNDRLVCAETTDASYATPRGLGVGTAYAHSTFEHELYKRSCQGWGDSGRVLIAIDGLEAELNSHGNVELLRVTI